MKCFAFDLGKVLFDFDYTIALDRLENKIKISRQEILDEIFLKDFTSDFEKGLISSRDFYEKFKLKFITSIAYEEFADIWCDIFSPNPEMIDLVEKISLLYPTYLISNINELHFEYLYKKYPEIFAHFDKLILSFKVKSLKPEKKIYEELKKLSGYNYEDIIYIDDRHDLIHEAKQLKIACIHFSNFTNLIASLNELKIMIPGDEEKSTLKYLLQEIKRHKDTLLVGLGNILKTDDGAGMRIAQEIKEKVSLKIIEAGVSLENYLNKISESRSDLVIFVDAAELDKNISFSCHKACDVQEISMYFTHDASLKLAMQYLQNQKSFDILILAIKASDFSFGENLGAQTIKTKILLSIFFIRNFPINKK